MATSPLELFKRGFGIRKPQSLKLSTDPLKDSIGSLLKFSPNELSTLIHRHSVSQKDKSPRPTGLTDFIAYFQPIHERSVQLVQDAERVKALIPEISQAEKLLVASIVSPNDLQEADPIYDIKDMPNLQESVVKEITDYLKDRFTNEYRLGEKIENSIREALFRSGAMVFLTLPESTLTRLANSVKKDKFIEASGYESLKEYCSNQNYKEILNKKIYTRNTTSSYSGNFNSKNISIENLGSHENNFEQAKKYYNDELKYGVESIYFGDKLTKLQSQPILKEEYKKYSAALEAMTATIVTKLEEGDIIKISENPEVLRFGRAVKHYEKTKLGKDFDKLWEDANKQRYGVVTGVQEEEVLDLTNYLFDDDEQKSLPFNIEIPAEAVIPICIPGQKREKLGYFILTDDHGRPIRASSYLTSGSGCTVSTRIANAYAMMYGQVPTAGGVQSPYMAFQQRPGTAINPTEDAMNDIFNYILDNMLRRKLKDIGLSEVTFDKYESIATCMFYRMLENKETSLVFVPEQLITYIAFDYRDNGCGRSLIENAEFTLSLMVALLTTNLMAQMKNAVAKQEIEVTFDEDETNQHQLIEQIKNAALMKSQINLTSNPADVIRAVTDQSISIKAVKHPNNPGFDITRTYTTDQMPVADTELLEKLQAWLTNTFGIPHSVFNQLDDAEFSRSIATSNLFFTQLIRSYQKVVCRFFTDFIKLNLKYSPTMQEGISKILNNHINGRKSSLENELDTPINDGGKDIKGDQLDIQKTLTEVISKVELSLPQPNIAPNQAQYNVVRDFKEILDGIVDNLYPDEIIHTDDQDGLNGLKVLKSMIKSNMTKTLLERIGLSTGLEIEELDDFLVSNRDTLIAINRISRNINQDITKDKVAQTTEVGNAEESGSSDTDSGMDNDYGF